MNKVKQPSRPSWAMKDEEVEESLPYGEDTPVWWHCGDERFYKCDWNKADYVLVPIEEYEKLVMLAADADCDMQELYK